MGNLTPSILEALGRCIWASNAAKPQYEGCVARECVPRGNWGAQNCAQRCISDRTVMGDEAGWVRYGYQHDERTPLEMAM